VSRVELVVPDLGSFSDVPVIDVLVKPGDAVEVDTPLITLETDKAAMDVPSTAAGKVVEVALKRGDKVSKGSVIARLETDGAGASTATPDRGADRATKPSGGNGATTRAESSWPDKRGPARPESSGDTVRMPIPGAPASARGAQSSTSAPSEARAPGNRPSEARGSGPGTPTRPTAEASVPVKGDTAGRKTQMLVLGAGPGGYTAAFRAADLGMQVTLVERWSALGGVCLNVGCIPSKALLHAAKVIAEAHSMSTHGIDFGAPSIDLGKLRDWKMSVVRKLTGGLKVLAKQRKVEVVQGTGRFAGPNVVEVTGENGAVDRIAFDHCIIAAGSEPVKLPNLPDDPRIMDSTGALELPTDVKRLLVIGGGIIGLEMACVYDALGTKVSVVELTPGLMPGCDPDLVRPLEKRLRARYEQILLGTKVTGIEARKDGLRVTFEGAKAPQPQTYDRVLVAVGRVPNGKLINAEAAGVKVSDRGFIPVDKQLRTNVPHIFAIGDIVGQPMLAHKAMHEAKVAAEVAAGEKRAFDVRSIPSVAYTDPEVAWTGLTEIEAQAKGIPVKKGTFPWVARGRSLSLGRDEGFTKLLFDPESHRLLGAGVVGPNAGELIAELVLGIEMGVDAADISLSVHPHPTLSETVGLAAEAFEGTLTDLYIPRR
jgi:dihydrolipoamide dehydrogenase